MHSSELRKYDSAFPLKCLTVPVLGSSLTKSVNIQPTHFKPSFLLSSFIFSSLGSGKCS
jgi:hypothetical protein